MRYDWNSFKSRKKGAKKMLGRKLANIRWARDRERRDKLAMLTAEQFPSHIVRRVVVIDMERVVREAVIWSFDSTRSARRKLRALGLP